MPMSNLGKRFNPFTAVKNYMEELNYRTAEKVPEGFPNLESNPKREKFRNVMRFFIAYYRIFAGELFPPAENNLKAFDRRHAGFIDAGSLGGLYNLEYAASRVAMKAKTTRGKVAAYLLLKGPLNLVRAVGGASMAVAFAIPSLFIYGGYKAVQAAKAKRLYKKFHRPDRPADEYREIPDDGPEMKLIRLPVIKTDKHRLDYAKLTARDPATQDPSLYWEITKKGKGKYATYMGIWKRIDTVKNWKEFSKVVMTEAAEVEHSTDVSSTIAREMPDRKSKYDSQEKFRHYVFRKKEKTEADCEAQYDSTAEVVQKFAYIPQ